MSEIEGILTFPRLIISSCHFIVAETEAQKAIWPWHDLIDDAQRLWKAWATGSEQSLHFTTWLWIDIANELP